MQARRLTAALVVVFALAGCSSDQQSVMPDVVGEQLDVAQSDIERAGFEDDVEVVGGGMFGVVDESNWQVCEQLPAAGEVVTDVPRLTVDRSCDDAKDGPGDTPTEEPEELETEAAEAYVYTGPPYEVVVVDDDITAANLKQYWIYTSALDTSTAAYKDQVKAIVTDIAHKEGTEKVLVEVVTDKEIAEAEAFSTMQSFAEEHGLDYFQQTIPQKEESGWVASYAGGFDYDTGEPSDAEDAFQVTWMIASDNPEFEQWKPEFTG